MELVHFASFVAKTYQENLDLLVERVTQHPAVVDWVTDHRHQLAFVIECANSEVLNDTMRDLHTIPNLLSLDLIYHETEKADLLEKEMNQ